ncbi:MAG TPA: hypothetical protein VK619_03620 [Pyrinomonadaceae bacterium]|nr:hypothetical protein [Pyrinomonadaceae bacterium]
MSRTLSTSIAHLLSAVLVLSIATIFISASASRIIDAQSQQSFPAPPADRTLVYYRDENSHLAALPFEAGASELRPDAIAKSDRHSYVELRGEHAQTILKTDEPRLYLFVADAANVHPPFLVRLTERRGARRVTAIAQKGVRGFAIDSEQIVKPHFLVLAREGGMTFMEIRPREPLSPGEYAIIGSDLARIATFRIAASGL